MSVPGRFNVCVWHACLFSLAIELPIALLLMFTVCTWYLVAAGMGNDGRLWGHYPQFVHGVAWLLSWLVTCIILCLFRRMVC